MLGKLMRHDWVVTDDPTEADTIVVNTCSFIEAAAEESIDAILQMAEFKKKGACRRLIVVGCLPERYPGDIADTLPEVDCFLGTGAFGDITAAVERRGGIGKCHFPDPDRIAVQGAGERRLVTTPHALYLKIAEGCSRHCTYCVIPKLRGTQKSRLPRDIVAEARALIANGARELTLVAQDTTAYGRDLGREGRGGLAGLLEALAGISNEVWFRVLYGHPESIDEAMIDAIGGHPNICSYFDIPIQHASDAVLRRMGRGYSGDDLMRLFERIRHKVPDAALRTTVIVGFPGESDDDFHELLAAVEAFGFDHLGAFVYSDAEDLASHRLPEHVPPKVAAERFDRLMSLQRKIAARVNGRHLGSTRSVLVEEAVEEGLYMGRTAFQAPEVDGVTFARCGPDADAPEIGAFRRVTIEDTLEYDLVGDIV